MPAMETHRGEPSPTHQAQAPGPMPTPSNAATPTDPPLDIAALMSQGEELYHACIMCHGMNGDGLAGQFPPLKGAPFVIGPESRLTRILLQGLQGPVVVNGTTYEMPMAPAPLNEDQEFAAIMTYIRRSFGNNASAVSPATVTRIRAETKDKDSSWTVEELEQVP